MINYQKIKLCVFQVAMSKYHTVFLSSDGRVYTCGHGRGGRLGHGNEQTIVVSTATRRANNYNSFQKEN